MLSLARRIANDGPLNELDAVGWAIRLAKRIEALHRLGVAHGNVSTACVETMGAERVAPGRLADVRTTTPQLAFQSPERAVGGDLSAADDTWSVAVTLYVMLTGSSPFEGQTDGETRQRIHAASPPPLAVHDVGDDDLQHILDTAFARAPTSRTQRVAVLRQSLEEWHPDPKVRDLAPLDDDEGSTSDEDDEDEHTQDEPTRDDEDEDEDERTMLRPMIIAPPGGPLAQSPESGRRPFGGPMANAVAALATPAGQARPAGPRPAAGGPAAAPPLRAAVGAPPASQRGGMSGGGPMFGGAAAQTNALFAPHAHAPHAAPGLALETAKPADPFGDDEDENAKTVMRDFPASVAEAARAAIAGAAAARAPLNGTAPHLPAAAPLQKMRPAAGAPADRGTGPMLAVPMAAPPPSAPGYRPRPNAARMDGVQLPKVEVDDDDSGDEQATMMREAGPMSGLSPDRPWGPASGDAPTPPPPAPGPGGYASHDTSPLQPIPQFGAAGPPGAWEPAGAPPSSHGGAPQSANLAAAFGFDQARGNGGPPPSMLGAGPAFPPVPGAFNGQMMQQPPPVGAPMIVDPGTADARRQRSRGLAIAAIAALFLAAGLTFALVRLLL